MSKNRNNDDGRTSSSLGRRMLLKLAGAATVGLPLAAYLGRAPWKGAPSARADSGEPRSRESYWHGTHFVQETVDYSALDSGVIRARINGEWRDFMNRPLHQDFIDWNFGARLDMINGAGPMCLDGPHSGCLATYGANRGDSVFSLNNAFKGFGFYPKESVLENSLQVILDNWSADMTTKLNILKGFYEDQSMWDFRLLSSLELYTTRVFETHSFLNQMANPIATICWLAIPGSYEVRAIARLIHPDDPDIPEMDLKRIHWTNALHDFYHGGPFPEADNLRNIGCIYYNVETFDNSPYPGLMGVRVTPTL